MDPLVNLKQLENKMLDKQVTLRLITLGIEVLEKGRVGKTPDYDAHARKLLAFIREHL